MSAWLWPDHIISRKQSYFLREEHNALVNSHAELLEALGKIRTAADAPEDAKWRIICMRDHAHPPIQKAEGG